MEEVHLFKNCSNAVAFKIILLEMKTSWDLSRQFQSENVFGCYHYHKINKGAAGND